MIGAAGKPLSEARPPENLGDKRLRASIIMVGKFRMSVGWFQSSAVQYGVLSVFLFLGLFWLSFVSGIHFIVLEQIARSVLWKRGII